MEYLKNLERSAEAPSQGGEGASVRALMWLRQAQHKAEVAGQALATFASASDVARDMHVRAVEVTQKLLGLEKVRMLCCTCIVRTELCGDV
jgi:hypothetical protein